MSIPLTWLREEASGDVVVGIATAKWASTDCFRDRKGVPIGESMDESFDRAEGVKPGILGDPSWMGLRTWESAGLRSEDFFDFAMPKRGIDGFLITGVRPVGVDGKEMTPGFGAAGC